MKGFCILVAIDSNFVWLSRNLDQILHDSINSFKKTFSDSLVVITLFVEFFGVSRFLKQNARITEMGYIKFLS
jgi:hypothetical protein